MAQSATRGTISENTQPRHPPSSDGQNIAMFGNPRLPLTFADPQIEIGQIGVKPIDLEQAGYEPLKLDQNPADAVVGGNFPLLFPEGRADQV